MSTINSLENTDDRVEVVGNMDENMDDRVEVVGSMDDRVADLLGNMDAVIEQKK